MCTVTSLILYRRQSDTVERIFLEETEQPQLVGIECQACGEQYILDDPKLIDEELEQYIINEFQLKMNIDCDKVLSLLE